MPIMAFLINGVCLSLVCEGHLSTHLAFTGPTPFLAGIAEQRGL